LSRDSSNHDASRSNALTLVSKTQHYDRRSLFRPLHFVSEKTVGSKFRTVENNLPKHRTLSAENSSVCAAATTVTLAPVAQSEMAPFMTESQVVTCVQFEVDTPDIDWEDLNRIERCCKSSSMRVIGTDLSKSSDASRSPVEDFKADQRRRDLLAGEVSPAQHSVSNDFNQSSSSTHCRADNKRKQCNSVQDILSSLLAMTPPPSSGQDTSDTILVFDTPVSDYGLSYRQRALRNGQVYLRDSVVRT